MTASAPELEMLNQILWTRLATPEAEHRFAPPRRWRFDLAWPAVKVALEVEGGVWAGGRHNRGSGYEADCEKYSEAAVQGWLVVRATPAMVSDGRALGLLERALRVRSAVPSLGVGSDTGVNS